MFARLADGNQDRVRAIEGQATLLGRTMHGIAYNARHDEVVVPQQFGQAILTFPGGASGEARPVRVIQGSKTQLIAPDRLAIDETNEEIYVNEEDKVLVFSRRAHGDVAPIRVLAGPDTRIGSARAVAIDTVRDLLIVLASPPGKRREYELLIFDRAATGNAKPKRSVSGLLAYGNVAVSASGMIFVVLPPRVGTDNAPTTRDIGYIGVWSVEDDGRVPPHYTVGGPRGVLIEPRGVALDEKHRTVIVSDKQLNAVLTFHAPELFGQSPAVPSPSPR